MVPLRLRAYVEEQRRRRCRQLLGQRDRGDALDPRKQVEAILDRLHPAGDEAGDVVESDSAEADRRLSFPLEQRGPTPKTTKRAVGSASKTVGW